MQSEPLTNCCADGLRVAILVSTYHSSITENLENGAKQAFYDGGGQPEHCIIAHTSGAWELPVLAQSCANANTVDAIVALGCIIAGETTHDRIIGDAIAHGLMQVALSWGHPVAMGVLTCQTLEQARERSNDTPHNKGSQAMLAAIGTVRSLRELQS